MDGLSRRFFRVTFVTFILLLLVQIGLAFLAGSWVLRMQVSDFLAVFISAWVTILLFLAAHESAQPGRRFSLAWLLIALAQFFWTIGDTAWLLFEVFLKISPYPSLADLFYMTYYPLFIAGLLRLPSEKLSIRAWIKLAIDMGIIMIASTTIFGNILIGPQLTQRVVNPFELLISVAYPVLDLCLIWAAIEVLLNRLNRTNPWPIFLLAIGAILLAVSDSIFSYLELRGAYTAGGLANWGWGGVYILTGMAGLVQAKTHTKDRTGPDQDFQVGKFSKFISEGMVYLPYGWAIGAFALLVVAHFAPYPMDFSRLATIVTVVFVLVIARQAVMIRENIHLYDQARRAQAELDHKVQARTLELQNEIQVRHKTEMALRLAHDELEARVDVRTRELAETNKELQAEIDRHRQAQAALQTSLAEQARANGFISALSEVAARVQATRNPEDVMETLGAELAEMGINCALSFLDEAHLALVIRFISIPTEKIAQVEKISGITLGTYEIPLENLVELGILREGKPVFISDPFRYLEAILPSLHSSQLDRLGWMLSISKVTPTVVLPLTIENRLLGGATVWGPDLRVEDIPSLTVFASQIAVAVENSQLFESVQRRANEAETLRQAAAAVSSALELSQVLDRILVQLERVVPYHSATVFLKEGNRLKVCSGRGFTNLPQLIGRTFPIHDQLLEEAAKTGNPIVLTDAQTDPRFHSWGDTRHVHGWLGVPLIARGQNIGFLTIDSCQINAYQASHAALAFAFANEAAIAIGQARLFEETRRLAITDPLTGLFNRRHFFELANQEFERSRRYGSTFSIIMMDLDYFKAVNDRFGHLCGDQALRTVALRCWENLREIDIIGRYGGEEFVVLLPETGLANAFQAAERLRCCISAEAFAAGEQTLELSASFGVAELGVGVTTADILLDRADQALLKAKKSGRNRIAIWEIDGNE